MRALLESTPARVLLSLAAATAVAVPAVTARADPIKDLRARAEQLRAEEDAVVLSLYALDTRLDTARTDLARVERRLGEIRVERARARAQLRLARRVLARSERALGVTLSALYVQSGSDPLAVILGARSLGDIVDGIDGLARTARQHAFVAAQTRRARERIDRLSRRLAAREGEARQLEAEAEATARSLAQTRLARSAYLTAVRSEQRVTADQIVEAEVEAEAARARAQAIEMQRTAGASTASFAANAARAAPPAEPAQPAEPETAATEVAPEPEAGDPQATAPAQPAPAPVEPAPVQAPPSGARTMTVSATAYSLRGTTATGIPVGWGVVAVDPTVIPLGTRMTIPGYGEGVAADTGPGVQGLAIDVWVPSEAQAQAWGTKTVTITLH